MCDWEEVLSEQVVVEEEHVEHLRVHDVGDHSLGLAEVGGEEEAESPEVHLDGGRVREAPEERRVAAVHLHEG